MDAGARPAPLQGELLSERREGSTGSRAERLVVPLAFLALGASLAFTVHPWYDGGADPAMYIATARSLLAGRGYTYLEAPFTVRPPGLSLLLVPIIAWRGVDFHAQHLLISAIGALGVVALFFWLRPRLGWILALLAAAFLWINPTYQNLCNRTMSDVPFVALVLACFLLDRRAARAPSWRREALLGLALGVTCYFRTVAVLMIPSIGLARLLARHATAGPRPWVDSLRRAAVSGGIASLIALSWIAYSSAMASPEPADQTRAHSYWTYLLHEDSADPDSPPRELSDVLDRSQRRAPRVMRVLGRRLAEPLEAPEGLPDFYEWGRQLCAAALLAALAVQTLRRRETPEIFAVVSLVVLLFYLIVPRYLLPTYLVALAALLELLRDGARRLLGPARGTVLVSVLLVGLIWLDMGPRRDVEELERGHRRRFEFFALLAAHLPPDARIATYRGFEYNVFLDQPTFSLHRAMRREGVGPGLDLILKRYDIDTVVLAPARGVQRRRLEEILTERFGAPEELGTVRIWRVRSAPGPAG